MGGRRGRGRGNLGSGCRRGRVKTPQEGGWGGGEEGGGGGSESKCAICRLAGTDPCQTAGT